MSQNFISITDASELSQKSIQTIRRAIKAKKIVFKRKRTPQGFNYVIEKQSLIDCYKIKVPTNLNQEAPAKETKKAQPKGNGVFVTHDDFAGFTQTLEKLLSQHTEERQNYLRLINTLQEKIFFLENQVNLLKGPEKKWYQLWK